MAPDGGDRVLMRDGRRYYWRGTALLRGTKGADRVPGAKVCLLGVSEAARPLGSRGPPPQGCRAVKKLEKLLASACMSWGIILTPPNRARELSGRPGRPIIAGASKDG